MSLASAATLAVADRAEAYPAEPWPLPWAPGVTVLAESAPSESFVDDDSRGMFHNAAEWERLYPGRERVPAVFCAPRVESGPQLEAIRRRLGLLAGEVAQAA